MTSGAKSEGRFGKQDFRYVAEDDVYICPAGERLTYRFTGEENGLSPPRSDQRPRRMRDQASMHAERAAARHPLGARALLEAVQRRLDADPGKMRVCLETVEHPFGTIKARMGATHFLIKTMPRVATEMALHVLAYNSHAF